MNAVNWETQADSLGATTIAGTLGDLYTLLPRLSLGITEAEHANVTELIGHFAQFAEAVGHAGLHGLQSVHGQFIERLMPFAVHLTPPPELVAGLEQWLQLNFDYLAQPNSAERWLALAQFLNQPLWNDNLTEGQIAILNRLFEIDAEHNQSSMLTTPDSGSTIIDAVASEVIAASLKDIAQSEELEPLHEESGAAAPDAPEAQAEELTYQPQAQLDVPSSAGELITLIHGELIASEETLSTQLESASTSALAGERPSFEDYRWQVERLANAAEAVGLKGLQEFLARIVESTIQAESAAQHDIFNHCEMLSRWPAIVTRYLESLGDPGLCQQLMEFSGLLEFATPLDQQASARLLDALRRPTLESQTSARIERPVQALDEHIALTVPDDINPELLDSMLHELPGQTQEFSAALQRIAGGDGGIDELRAAQRIAHTLKGAANTVGIRGIAELAHHLEDIFTALESSASLPPKNLSRVLIDAADCLEAMSEALVNGAPSPSQSLELLQEILDWANRIDREGVEATLGDEGAGSTVTMPVLARVPEQQPAPQPERPFIAPHSEVAAATPTLRIPTTHIDDLLRLSGESKIIGGQLKEGLRRVDTQLHAVRRQNQLLQQLVNELEQLVDIRGVTMPMQRRTNGDFDALEMDQYGELHTVSRRLAEVAVDSREWSAAAQGELHSLEDLLLSQTRQSNDTQESILKMRMVPATTIVGRLQRGVRQTCRLLDKEVELSVKGADTLIDSDSLNQLIDPLMHLIRNAVDHGVEAGAERESLGKSRAGRLSIEFGREGNQIVVRVHDDGRGLNYDAIRGAAEERGLLANASLLTEAQLARLILQPGFSTRSDVTQVSGRGIGLDIVHSKVAELKGTLDVQSETGRGCRFVIRLPATLISAHALLVKHGKHTVAVASRGVRQILDAHSGRVSTLGNRLTLQLGDQAYEAHRLETLLGHATRSENESLQRPALLVEVASDRICAILVQAVVDTIDLVVKPLGPFVPRSVGLVGATILGDGGVAPVMDLPDLLRAQSQDRREIAVRAAHDADAKGRAIQSLPSVLVVDDSLSVRRSMEQLLRDAGYDVRLARDGMEAVAILENRKPDLMLVDLEMPRMNGMELTAHVRNRADTRDLPVIMITSRSTDKHRKQAQVAGVNHYMTKPYAEDALLEHLNKYLRQGA